MSLKSINDGIVALTESAGNMNAFVNTVLGYSTVIKAIPKYLAELPARFQEVVPNFIKQDLPEICEKSLDPFLTPVKNFLSYVDFFGTVKVITDKDFASKSTAKKGNAISKLIASGIDTAVLIPAKLKWYDFAGWASEKLGSISPYLQTAFSISSFTLVGNIASIAASIFSLKNCADERGAAEKKIDLAQKNIKLLSGALEDKVTDKKIKKICRDYFLCIHEKLYPEDIQSLSQRIVEDLTKAYTNAVKELYNKHEALNKKENHLHSARTARKQSAIDKLTKEKEKLYADLEINKEEIRRMDYFWNEFSTKDVTKNVQKAFAEHIIKDQLTKFLSQQKELAAIQAKAPEDQKEASKSAVLASAAIARLEEILKSDNIYEDLKAFLVEDANSKDAVLIEFGNSMDSVGKGYANKLESIIPKIKDKSLKTRIIKHVVNFEIDRNEIEVRTQKSQVTRSWVVTAFESAKIALTALLATKPIMALAGMAGVSLGVAISAPVLAGISAALVGVGFALSIAGTIRSFHNTFHWLDPKNQAKAQTHIGELVSA